MVRTRQIEVEEFAEEIAYTIQKKVFKHNDDYVLPICGYEGRGKSTFSIAVQCLVYELLDRKPNKYHICFSWEEYLIANIQRINNMIAENKSMGPGAAAIIDELYTHYQIDLEGLETMFETDYHMEEGTILVYDEAGTQANARQSASGENIDMSKLLILNRFLKLCHLLNVPKPGSLDIYAREQRPRGMIWCTAEYTPDLENRLRNVYYYTQPTYMKLLQQRNYKTLFSDDWRPIKAVAPDWEIMVRDRDLRKFIPKDILETYENKKLVFGLKQTSGMMRRIINKQKKEEGREDEAVDKLVRQGETQKEWVKRTKMSPMSYRACGGKVWRKRGRPKKTKD